MLAYAEKITVAPSTISEKDIEALHTVGFGDEEILDIVLVCAYRNFISRVADALGVDLEEVFRRDTTLVEGLTVGRAL